VSGAPADYRPSAVPRAFRTQEAILFLIGGCFLTATAREPLSRARRPLGPYLLVMVLMPGVVTDWPWLTLVGPRLLLHD
jgi:hypothetical protein